jgi:hypothetical protein
MHPPDAVLCIATPRTDATPRMARPRLRLPADLTSSQLVQTIRKRVNLTPTATLFAFCENRMLTGDTSVLTLLRSQKATDDGILHVTYSLENAFG